MVEAQLLHAASFEQRDGLVGPPHVRPALRGGSDVVEENAHGQPIR